MREGWVEVPPPIGGRFLRTYRRLLAISALISVSAYFRLLPPRLSNCSSIASVTVLLCGALVLAPMCTDFLNLLCLTILSCNMSFESSLSTCFLLLVSGSLLRLEFFFAAGLVARPSPWQLMGVQHPHHPLPIQPRRQLKSKVALKQMPRVDDVQPTFPVDSEVSCDEMEEERRQRTTTCNVTHTPPDNKNDKQ